MNPREDIGGLTNQLAHRLSAMVESGLLTWREYIPWADSIITEHSEPPIWIIDLSTQKHRDTAAATLRRHALFEPLGSLHTPAWVDEYVAGLFLRHERGEISWATFLQEAGRMADNTQSGREPECEYFFLMLNALGEADYAKPLEATQVADVSTIYRDVIDSVRCTYQAVRRFRDGASQPSS